MDGFKNSPGEFFRLPFQHFDVFPVNLVSSFEFKVCSPEHLKKKLYMKFLQSTNVSFVVNVKKALHECLHPCACVSGITFIQIKERAGNMWLFVMIYVCKNVTNETQ